MLQHIDLANVWVLDIETVPYFPDYEQVPAEWKALWEHKSAYQRKDDCSAEDFYDKAGIWAEFGKIICISVGIFAGKSIDSLRIKSFFGHDEKEILENFVGLLKTQPSSLILCAHNGKEFDFPYLCRRMLVNRVIIPSQLDLTGKKKWEVNHLDTMELWRFGDYKNYTSLDLLAKVFDIPTPKDDITGADVSRVYWKEKDLDRIVSYCQKDVITTCRLLQRYTFRDISPDESIVIVP